MNGGLIVLAGTLALIAGSYLNDQDLRTGGGMMVALGFFAVVWFDGARNRE